VSTAQDARVALLSGLIDHAPLFPPASLALPDALAADARARASASAFMLGRFVCPATGLARLPDVGRGVSVVLQGPYEPEARVEAVEAKGDGDLSRLAGLAPEVYVELPAGDDLEERLDEVARLDLGAKVRCGGAVVPSEAELGGFVRACGERGIPFKATAGLHHAVRTGGEHGFLNLLAAVVFGEEEDALAEADPEAFSLDADGFSWGGRQAEPPELAQARVERLRSIGSCSFFEPVEELEKLGVLPL
jgi:hypothetical protein